MTTSYNIRLRVRVMASYIVQQVLVQRIIMHLTPVPFLCVGQRILKEMQRKFMECVDAEAIAQKARFEEIIPQPVEKQIREARSSDAANIALFEHLHDQVMPEGLRRFCFMIESKSFQQMQMFGKELLAKLEEVRWSCTN